MLWMGKFLGLIEMQTPLQVTARDMPHSAAVDESIRAKAAKLEQFLKLLTSCRVLANAPYKNYE
jgi:hypothetical protein